MNPFIEPTIGRKVWFFAPNDQTLPGGMIVAKQGMPFSAEIVYVHNDTMVNLAVYDHYGRLYQIASVTLLQENMPKPGGFYCEWMPFQKGQAKAQEQAKSPS